MLLEQTRKALFNLGKQSINLSLVIKRLKSSQLFGWNKINAGNAKSGSETGMPKICNWDKNDSRGMLTRSLENPGQSKLRRADAATKPCKVLAHARMKKAY